MNVGRYLRGEDRHVGAVRTVRPVAKEPTAGRTISPDEFARVLRAKLREAPGVKAVCGPGRSGAIAAVYASHMLGIPFIPYDRECPEHLRPLLVIDTATQSGRTLRKAERRHPGCIALAVFHEPPRVRFWYEAGA